MADSKSPPSLACRFRLPFDIVSVAVGISSEDVGDASVFLLLDDFTLGAGVAICAGCSSALAATEGFFGVDFLAATVGVSLFVAAGAVEAVLRVCRVVAGAAALTFFFGGMTLQSKKVRMYLRQ